MKKLSQIAKTYAPGNQPGHELQNTIPPECKQIVDSLFAQLPYIFPAWGVNWKGKTEAETARKVNTAKKEWVKAFFENGITTSEQLKRGLVEARKSDSDFFAVTR